MTTSHPVRSRTRHAAAALTLALAIAACSSSDGTPAPQAIDDTATTTVETSETVVGTAAPTTDAQLPTPAITQQPPGVVFDVSDRTTFDFGCWDFPEDPCPGDQLAASQLFLTHYTGTVTVQGVTRLDQLVIDDPLIGGGPGPLITDDGNPIDILRPADGEELILATVALAKNDLPPAVDTDPVNVTLGIGAQTIYDFANQSGTATIIASVPIGEPLSVVLDTLGDTSTIAIGDTAERTADRPRFYDDISVAFSADQTIDVTGPDGETETESIEVWTERLAPFAPSYTDVERDILAPPGNVFWNYSLRAKFDWSATGLTEQRSSYGPPDTCDIELVLDDGTTTEPDHCQLVEGISVADEIELRHTTTDGPLPVAITVNNVTATGPDGTVTTGPVTIPVVDL